ncbi:MAG TPA: hypothetical protein VJP60_05055 [Rhizomicrobium sp.]|nr:hypothetical protein [Rhizomicrobium sp.]
MKHKPKKLDMEAAFREVTQPAPAFENSRWSLKPLFQIYDLTKPGLFGNLFLALFSLLTAGIAFVAVFKLVGWSPLALYYALLAATVVGALTAPLRYQWLVARALPFSALPESEPPPLPGELSEIRADLQRGTLRNRAIMRVAVFGYVLCLWLLSVTNSDRLHGMHMLMLIIVVATPVLLFLTIWLALGPLSKNS